MDKERLIQFIQRDFLYIVVCLFALFACLYIILSVQTYQDHCNEFWHNQTEQCTCPWDVGIYNWQENFSLKLPMQDLKILGGDDND